MSKFSFIAFPNLTTERLILRQLNIKDEKEIFAIRSDEEVSQFLDRPRATKIDDARDFIDKINFGITKNEVIYWAITLKPDPKLIGTVCFWNISREKSKAEIGFELLPEFQGKGIMQEVLPAVIKYGFEKMKLSTIEGEVDPNNLKSIKLMEKYGFVYNRKLKNTVVYSLSNETV